MKLIKLTLNNFQSYKSAEVIFDKINIIIGKNFDNPNSSSNGAGKSVLVNNAIEFCLYSDVSGLTLNDLIHSGSKNAFVFMELEHEGNLYKIERKIPTELNIYKNDQIIEFNTIPLKQKFIDDIFGDHTYFKRFRSINISEGINLLDYCRDTRSLVTLKKILMDFIENEYNDIRNKLLEEKNYRSKYLKSEKPIDIQYTPKREEILKNGLTKLNDQINYLKKEINDVLNDIVKKRSIIEKSKQIIYEKNKEIKLLQKEGKCPLCLQPIKDNSIYKQKESTIFDNQKILTSVSDELHLREDIYDYDYKNLEKLNHKLNKINKLLYKLEEAKKFSEYKFTEEDIKIVNDAILLIDNFTQEYINSWLKNLETIINNLLSNVNLQMYFTNDKNFLELLDADEKRKYSQLSSGQRLFISTIFKLSILIHKNESGLVIIDEGLQYLDHVNLLKLIEIFKTLNFQVMLTYQNIPDISDINVIQVIRKNGISEIKK